MTIEEEAEENMDEEVQDEVTDEEKGDHSTAKEVVSEEEKDLPTTVGDHLEINHRMEIDQEVLALHEEKDLPTTVGDQPQHEEQVDLASEIDQEVPALQEEIENQLPKHLETKNLSVREDQDQIGRIQSKEIM